MKIIEKKCPNCNANLDFKVGERDVECKSCRRKFAIEYDHEMAEDHLRPSDFDLKPMKAAHTFIFIIAALIIVMTIFIFVITAINTINMQRRANKIFENSFEILDND